jgi:hypothetical protein
MGYAQPYLLEFKSELKGTIYLSILTIYILIFLL